MKRSTALVAFLSVASLAFGQADPVSGEASMADRYLAYAMEAAREGRWKDAEETLDRAADFASVSSDLSYYGALARLKLGRPVGAVLEALYRAVEADRWRSVGAAEARLLEAECLVRVRSFPEALAALSYCPESADSAALRLRCLRSLGDMPRFIEFSRIASDSYPRDPRFPALLFQALPARVQNDAQRRLVDSALKRLPFLLEVDPSLAVRAAPYILDADERRRLLGAYRALGSPLPSSVPLAMDLGLLSDDAAAAELFSRNRIDADLLVSVYDRLVSSAGRAAFARRLGAYSGTLVRDADGDEAAESRAVLERGTLVSFSFDVDQDGIDEWLVRFEGQLPSTAEIALAADREAGDADSVPARPVRRDERSYAVVEWERYPYVASVRTKDRRYGFPPAAFAFSPVALRRPIAESDLRLPDTDAVAPRLTERSLRSFASYVEGPGTLASGSVERIDFADGIPLGATERLGDRVVGRSEYRRGVLVLRRRDLDADGRFETVEGFDPLSGKRKWSETDFDGDGIFERESVE